MIEEFYRLGNRHALVIMDGKCGLGRVHVGDISKIKSIRYAALHPNRDPSKLADAFAANDMEFVYCQLDGAEQLHEITSINETNAVTIRQGWSFDELRLTKRRSRYTQSFGCVVFHVHFNNGDSQQYVVELSPYGREASLNIGSM